MQLVQRLENQIDNALRIYVTQVSSSLTNWLVPLAVAGTTLYLMYTAYGIARGDIPEPMSKLSKDVMNMALISALALGFGNYEYFVIDAMNDLTAELTSKMTSGSGGTRSVGATIDSMFEGCITPPGETECIAYPAVLFNLAVRNSSTIGIPDMTYLGSGICVAIANIAIMVLSMLPFLLAKVALAVFLAIGPVFILCLMWPATRNYFSSWLSATVGNALTLALVAGIVSIATTIFRVYVTDSFLGIEEEGADVITRTSVLLIVAIGMGFAVLATSQMGAQLAGGGVAMDSKGVGGMIVQSMITRMAVKKGQGDGAAATGGQATKPTPVAKAATRTGNLAGSMTRNVIDALARKRK